MPSDLYRRWYSDDAEGETPREIPERREFYCSRCGDFAFHSVVANGGRLVQECLVCHDQHAYIPTADGLFVPEDYSEYDLLTLTFGIAPLARALDEIRRNAE